MAKLKKQLTAAEKAELKKILATVKEGIRRWAPIYKHHTWTYRSGGRGGTPAILTVAARDGKCIAWTTEGGMKPAMADRTLFPTGFMSTVKRLAKIGLVSKAEQKRLEALNRRVFDASCERANWREAVEGSATAEHDMVTPAAVKKRDGYESVADAFVTTGKVPSRADVADVGEVLH